MTSIYTKDEWDRINYNIRQHVAKVVNHNIEQLDSILSDSTIEDLLELSQLRHTIHSVDRAMKKECEVDILTHNISQSIEVIDRIKSNKELSTDLTSKIQYIYNEDIESGSFDIFSECECTLSEEEREDSDLYYQQYDEWLWTVIRHNDKVLNEWSENIRAFFKQINSLYETKFPD